MLKQYGASTRAKVAEYCVPWAPHRYLSDLLADYPRRGGKMMRPSLCIATSLAFGGSAEDALQTAAAIELLHNAILIHDDIEDGSTERRGEPTLHLRHGVPLAINAGDSLSLLSLQPLLDNRSRLGARLAARVLEETMTMARATAEGQAIELGWRRDNVLHVDVTDYLDMVLRKTCWLATIHPLRVGALIGTRDVVDLEPFIRFGFFLGAAFQIQDDLLNLVADDRYGKELHGDLWEGKRTLMLIRLLRIASYRGSRTLGRIAQPPRRAALERGGGVVWAAMKRYDCVDYARAVAHGLAGAAQYEFAALFSASRSRATNISSSACRRGFSSATIASPVSSNRGPVPGECVACGVAERPFGRADARLTSPYPPCSHNNIRTERRERRRTA